MDSLSWAFCSQQTILKEKLLADAKRTYQRKLDHVFIHAVCICTVYINTHALDSLSTASILYEPFRRVFYCVVLRHIVDGELQMKPYTR